MARNLAVAESRAPAAPLHYVWSFPGSEPPDSTVIAALSPDLPGEPSRVGYYRIQHGGFLRLNESDLALAEAAFPEPQQVFLLIQLGDPGPANATFFFWDAGRMC